MPIMQMPTIPKASKALKAYKALSTTSKASKPPKSLQSIIPPNSSFMTALQYYKQQQQRQLQNIVQPTIDK